MNTSTGDTFREAVAGAEKCGCLVYIPFDKHANYFYQHPSLIWSVRNDVNTLEIIFKWDNTNCDPKIKIPEYLKYPFKSEN